MRQALIGAVLLLAGCAGSVPADPKGLEAFARYKGALALAESGDPVDERELLTLLNDPDPLARDGAVVALGRLGKAEHVPALIDMTFLVAEKQDVPLVRADAVRALARIRDPRAVKPIVAAVKDVSPEVRRTAIVALGAFPDQTAALEALIDAVESKEAPVAQNARETLARISKRTDIPPSRDAWLAWLKERAP